MSTHASAATEYIADRGGGISLRPVFKCSSDFCELICNLHFSNFNIIFHFKKNVKKNGIQLLGKTSFDNK